MPRVPEPPGRVPYVLTAHATLVISARGIGPGWIALVLEAPELLEADRADPELRHALRRIPERGNRMLRVVYNEASDPPRIVTAYFDRRAG